MVLGDCCLVGFCLGFLEKRYFDSRVSSGAFAVLLE